MSIVVNRRRLMSTLERHVEEWELGESYFVRARSVAFQNLRYSAISVELFPLNMGVFLWSDYEPGSLRRWAVAPYAGKMYRNVQTMASQIRKRLPRNREDTITSDTGHFPLEIGYEVFSLNHILARTLSNEEDSPGTLRAGWTSFATIPDEIIRTVDLEVSRAAGVEMHDPIDMVEPIETLGSVEEDYDGQKEDEVILPKPTGPIRMIRI
jgi:hypothetical protein